MEQLTIRNAHRAKVVRRFGETDSVHFGLGRKFLSTTYFAGENEVYPTNFRDWEVLEFEYPVTLDEFWDLSQNAFSWTSFDPERRGQRAISEHEKELNRDLADIPEGERERYIAGYKKYFSAWLSACSNCASSAITGGSGFNAPRAEKANNREHARMEDFIQWRKKALKAIARKEKENRTGEEKQGDDWSRLKQSIISYASTIAGINDGTERGYNKSLFVNSIYNKVETYAKHGDVAIVEKATEIIRELNKQSSIITERHKFFKLLESAKIIADKLGTNAEKENSEAPFVGGKMISNFAEDRIQLIFDGKPSPDIISQLKRSAFRWSPRFGAWQRQMTVNGMYAAKTFLKSNNLLIVEDK